MSARLLSALLAISVLLTGCSDGKPAPLGIAEPTTVSGRVTFDFVPAILSTEGEQAPRLDYNNIQIKPARGIRVQAWVNGEVQATTETDGLGNYSFLVPGNQQVSVVAETRIFEENGNETYVTDASDSIFSIREEFRSQSSTRVVDLHAELGWDADEARYNDPDRESGPFAILDTIRTCQLKIKDAEPELNLPSLQVIWRTNVSGSSFTFVDGLPTIRITGVQNFDTDEFDTHIIAHEWTHYLMSTLSADDSTGGTHSQGDLLDESLAFSEGLANAMSGMFLDDGRYFDTKGTGQNGGFWFDMEEDSTLDSATDDNELFGIAPKIDGAHSEQSVQEVIWDLYDDSGDTETEDQVSLSFNSIWQALRSETYSQTAYFTSIYVFLQAIKTFDTIPSDINQLAEAENIDASQNLHHDPEFELGTRYIPLTTTITDDQLSESISIEEYVPFPHINNNTRTLATSITFDAGIGLSLYERLFFETTQALPVGSYLLIITPSSGNTVIRFPGGFPELTANSISTLEGVQERFILTFDESRPLIFSIEGHENTETTFSVTLELQTEDG